jgi:hypothetical protein
MEAFDATTKTTGRADVCGDADDLFVDASASACT